MGINAAAGRRIEGNSRIAAAATRRAAAPTAALAAVALALGALAGCGGTSAETDPLASIAAAVREEDRAPAPLAEVWRRTPEEPVTLSPAVGDRNVYVALRNRLYAWATLDGTPRWAPIELESEISAAPVVLDDQIVVATRGDGDAPPRLWWFGSDSTPVSQTPLQSPIREISAARGTVVYVDERGVGSLGGGNEWHVPLEQAATVELAVEHRLALATTGDGVLHALDLATGATRWQYTSDGQITRARVAGDRVFVGAGALGVVALRADDGREAWRRPLGTAVAGAPAIAQDLVWVAALDAKLHAYKASNGTEMEGYLLGLSSRNYLDVVSYEPWVVVGALRGPWIAVRGPTRAELGQRAQQRPQQITVRQPGIEGSADLTVGAGSGPAGVAVVINDGTVVFLEPQRSR